MKSYNIQKIAIIILALIGLAMSIELAIVYQNANTQYSLASFCSVNDFVDCDGVAKSSYSQAFGIPLAWWGIFFYITILFLSFVDKLKKNTSLKFLEVFKNPNAYISTLGTIAFMISMVLATISLNVINKICILCIGTYFIDLIIAIIASNASLKILTANIKTTFVDFISGAKQYTKTFIALVLLFVGFLTYSSISLNFVPHIKKSKSLFEYRALDKNPFKATGNILGDKNAKVVIRVYSDYVCPICRVNNIMLHQAAKEFSNIRIEHHHYPFDKDCNPFISASMHPKACFMSRAAIAAGMQNNYWEMNTLLYEEQPKNYKEMMKLVKQLNFDEKKFVEDFNSQEITEEIYSDIISGLKLRINATPTMYINKEQIVGIKPYYILRDKIKAHGGKQVRYVKLPAKNKFVEKIKEYANKLK